MGGVKGLSMTGAADALPDAGEVVVLVEEEDESTLNGRGGGVNEKALLGVWSFAVLIVFLNF